MTMIVIRSSSWAWTTTHTQCMTLLVKKLFSLYLTASVAQWHSTDSAPSGLAAADWGGHPHFCPACHCHPRVHGRHPTTDRLEVNWRHMESPWSTQQCWRRWEGWGLGGCRARGRRATLLSKSYEQLLRSAFLECCAHASPFSHFRGGNAPSRGDWEPRSPLEKGALVKAVGACERGMSNVCVSPHFAGTATLMAATTTPSCSSPRC